VFRKAETSNNLERIEYHLNHIWMQTTFEILDKLGSTWIFEAAGCLYNKSSGF